MPHGILTLLMAGECARSRPAHLQRPSTHFLHRSQVCTTIDHGCATRSLCRTLSLLFPAGGKHKRKGMYFDATLAQILEDLGASEAADYAEDLAATDALGISTAQRLAMYTPLCYLLESEDGYGTSDVAKYWRIRTGLSQGDTSLTTEVNLALALQSNEAVESVDFATVWGQQHTEAEVSGSGTGNFVAWAEECTE